MSIFALSPCFLEFRRERAFPASVLGPVLFWAFALFACSCFSVAISVPPSSIDPTILRDRLSRSTFVLTICPTARFTGGDLGHGVGANCKNTTQSRARRSSFQEEKVGQRLTRATAELEYLRRPDLPSAIVWWLLIQCTPRFAIHALLASPSFRAGFARPFSTLSDSRS